MHLRLLVQKILKEKENSLRFEIDTDEDNLFDLIDSMYDKE